MLRYSKSAVASACVTAVLWAGAIALLIGQLDDPPLRPFAVITAIVAGTATIVWAIDRVAARYMSRDTRPPIVVHADWTPEIGSMTTFSRMPAMKQTRVVSVPVPVPSCAGSGDTTVTFRRQSARETVPEDTYFAAFDALAEDVLAEFDQRDGGADSVQ